MKRPPVVLDDNLEALYEYYKQREARPRFTNFAHNMAARILRPHVVMDDVTRKQIDEHLQQRGQVILAANHRSWYDPFVVAAMPPTAPELEPLSNRTFIPGMQRLFRNPAVRTFVENLGSVPVFREKDVAGNEGDLRKKATALMIDTCIDRMQKGYNLAMFPEGGINSTAPHEMRPLKNGIARIAGSVSLSTDLLVIPVGIDYGSPDTEHIVGATTFVGTPLEGPFETDHFMTRLVEAMDETLEAARVVHLERTQ